MERDLERRLAELFGGHPEVDDREAVESLVHSQLTQYLDPAAVGPIEPLEVLEQRFLSAQVPESPTELRDYLDRLFQEVLPHAVRVHSPRFIGHMTSALPGFVDPLARLITALNQNVVKVETSRALTFVERQALAMLHRLVFGETDAFYAAHAQHPDSTLGMVVSGGTLANLTALWCARNAVLGPGPGFDGVEAEGLAAALQAHGARRAAIVGSSLMHYSFTKAVDLLGLGSRGLVRVQADSHSRVDADAVERTLDACEREGTKVLAVVGIAGATETGGVDPLEALADVAHRRGIHFHVDAAWGGPVLFSRTHRGLLRGIERADTVTIDGHKQLYLPMGTGVVLMKEPHMARSIEKSAQYIVRAGSRDLGRRAVEGSRPATSLFLHAALHLIGHRGYGALIDAGIERAHHMADAIRARTDFELLAEPELNILVYRYVPPEVHGREPTPEENERLNALNVRLQETQREEGRTFISRTLLTNTRHGVGTPVVSLRAVLANPLTTREDIHSVLAEQARLAGMLAPTFGF
jgi:putative pyridoxal-dependent aspartate 1-decarboxylase